MNPPFPPPTLHLLDLQTIDLIVAVTFLIQALVIAINSRLARQYRGIRMFLASEVVLAASFLLLVLLPVLPPGPVGLLSSAFFLWGLALQYGAVVRFTDQQPSRTLLWGLAVVGSLVLLLLVTWPFPLPFVAIRELLAAPLLFGVAYSLKKADITTYRTGAIVTGLPFVGYGCLSVYRVIRGVLDPSLMRPGPSVQNDIDALLVFVLSFLWTAGFLLMINQRLQADLLRLATRDSLTGCLNRRAMAERLEGELLRYRRYGREFAVLLLDLDRFKGINDRWGHAAGDEVLSGIAQVLHGALRGGDSLARWGGEEFLACLPETELDEAAHLADRLRDLVADQTFSFADVSVTFSAGVASIGPDESIDALCRRADQALYRAKETRNRTVKAEADPPA